MGRRRKLTDEGVAKLEARRKRYAYPDPEMPGHYIRVTPTGEKSFVAVVYDRAGKQRWLTIGKPGPYNIEQARKRASELIRAIKEGRSEPDSFEAVAAKWRELHCEARKLRSIYEIDRFLKRMTDAWTGRDFTSIGRGDIAKLLDQIESKNGPRQATYCLQVFSSLANWYAARDDNYRSPIVRGMRRGSPANRDRVLSDDELRALWAVADGQYGTFVKLALLTAQRRDKIATMKWGDLDGNVWTIATEPREKPNAGELVLPETALNIINAQPRYGSNPYVFAGRGDSHITGWTWSKSKFDAKLEDVEPWTIHDLRRTARTLMERAGVRPDIAERVPGHVIPGVHGIYNRHEYREEKAHALRALAGMIDNIVNPPADNVVTLATTGRNA
jgi:integrase